MGEEKILVVEPSCLGRRLLFSSLQRSGLGYNIITSDGVRDLRSHASEIKLVLTADYVTGGTALDLTRVLRNGGYTGHVAVFAFLPLRTSISEPLERDLNVSLHDKAKLLGTLPACVVQHLPTLPPLASGIRP